MQIAKRNACKMTVKSLNIRKLNGRFEYETDVAGSVQGGIPQSRHTCRLPKNSCFS